MVRYIKLNLDEDRFYKLKDCKDTMEGAGKKKLTWEDFLCDWVLTILTAASQKGIDNMLENVYSSIKEEQREEFEMSVKTIIADKLKYYHT